MIHKIEYSHTRSLSHDYWYGRLILPISEETIIYNTLYYIVLIEVFTRKNIDVITVETKSDFNSKMLNFNIGFIS